MAAKKSGKKSSAPKAPKAAKAAKATPSKPAKAPEPKCPTPEEIGARAHQIWVDEGRPEGKSVEHWLRAERELSG